MADGLESGSRPRNEGARWGWLVAGILVGIGISILVFRPDPLPTAPVPTKPDALLQDMPAEGIADVVPGFPDGLIAVSSSNGRTLGLTTWPVSGPDYDRPLPLGTSIEHRLVRLDVSGRRVATLRRPVGEVASVLIAGVSETARPIDTNVTGYAWHDSVAGSLAFTTVEDRELLLWVIAASMAEPQLLRREAGVDGRLVAWGEWGFAIQDHEDTAVTVLTPDGQEKRSDPGRLLTSHQSGWLVIVDDEVKLIGALAEGASGYGAVAGTRDFEDRFALVGNPLTAAISPDGRRLAVLGNGGLLVLPIEGDSAAVQAELRNGVAQVAWSSDSRFVLVPGIRGLAVVDTRDGRLDYVFGDRTVLGVSVLPIAD